jgi:hypothetical protein
MKALAGVAAALELTAAAITGCESGPRMEERAAPSLSITRNHGNILTGETTAIITRTANLLGRDVTIRWSTTLGKVTPAEGGRLAYFTSDQPGTAVVTAEMHVDGRVIRDHTNVTVNAIRW